MEIQARALRLIFPTTQKVGELGWSVVATDQVPAFPVSVRVSPSRWRGLQKLSQEALALQYPLSLWEVLPPYLPGGLSCKSGGAGRGRQEVNKVSD